MSESNKSTNAVSMAQLKCIHPHKVIPRVGREELFVPNMYGMHVVTNLGSGYRIS